MTLLPECMDDYVGEDNSVRVVDGFINELGMVALPWCGVRAASRGTFWRQDVPIPRLPQSGLRQSKRNAGR